LIPVEINGFESYALMKLALERNANKELHNVASKKIDEGLTEVDAHYAGIKSEYAVAKTIGVEINMENMLRGDGGVDLIYRGHTIDVKYSSLELKMDLEKGLVADIAILVHPLKKDARYGKKIIKAVPDPYIEKPFLAWRSVKIMGFIPKCEFDEKHRIEDFGGGKCMVVGHGDLHDMSELKAWTQANLIAESKDV
jgi:hypothetical protein